MNVLCFEREELTALLQKRLSGFLAGYRQNLALIGPEGAGKTTLLQRFLQGAGQGSALVCVYLEVMEEGHLEEWASRFVQAVLYGFSRMRRPQDPPIRLPDLLQFCAEELPRSAALARRALQLAEMAKADEAYALLWDLPHLLSQEGGVRILLVLDEFHHLRSLPVREPFRAVGRKIMLQNSTMYVAASSQPMVARSILREGLALLFGQFEMVEVRPLQPEACRWALRSVWPATHENPLAEHVLLDLAQGRPDRLHLLLQILEQARSAGVPMEAEQVLPFLLEALFLQPQWRLRQKFEAQLRSLPVNRGRLLCLQVLGAVASGLHRVREIARSTSRSSSQVARALRLLEQGKLLVHRGPFYWIPDRLLAIWLLTTHPILQGFEWAGEEQVRAHHRQAILAWISRIREATHQPLEARVLELLRRWDGERVEVEGRPVLLPAFRRMDPVAGLRGGPVWEAHRAAKGDGGRWLIHLRSGPLGEAEATQLVQSMREGSAYRRHRKLLLGAHPVEVNARLILQQGRIRLWDFHVVNDLLDLYGLPRLPSSAGGASPVAETVAFPPAGPSTELKAGQEAGGSVSAASGFPA